MLGYSKRKVNLVAENEDNPKKNGIHTYLMADLRLG